ncbi:hypothetical protein [Rossellomorea marisflavi]|uniref:hypothetical protein n=1 Tax=Rossellomorea marisflavi TaxID=189381 RepID=UPI003F9F93EE
MRKEIIEAGYTKMKNNEHVKTIIDWVLYHKQINSVLDFFEFVLREVDDETVETVGNESLKTAWNQLSEEERAIVTYKIAKIYVHRKEDTLSC